MYPAAVEPTAGQGSLALFLRNALFDRDPILRRAFDATMADPELLDEGKKMSAEIRPVRGEGVAALVTKIVNTPKDLAERARADLAP
jgi:hypothetical protein